MTAGLARLPRGAAAVIAWLLLAGCAIGSTSPTSTPTPSATTAPGSRAEPPIRAQSAADALAALAVKGRAPMTGYDRVAYGQPWLDADRNGCDTRNDVLGEQLTAPAFKAGTRRCKVLSGLLDDPYTGTEITFDDSAGDGSGIDIDHVVALGNSWATGAFEWSVPQLAALANDPLNLLAVDASANRSKGDGDAATWLPPRKESRCAYVARQVAVKVKYQLWVTEPERAAITRVLAACPAEPLPSESGAPTTVSFLAEAVSGTSCASLAARGLTPVRRGDTAYDPSLDGDDDGVACE